MLFRTLVAAGFKVIGGAQDVEKAEDLLEEAVNEGLIKQGAARNVKIVPFDIRIESSIRDAIGSAGKVWYSLVFTFGRSKNASKEH